MNRFKRLFLQIIIGLSVFVFVLLSASTVGLAYAPEEKFKTIRVAYPIINNLTEKVGDNTYQGYTYEYLNMIAEYAGWTYEFVEVEGDNNEQILKLMEMVKNGEVDLMGGLVFDDSLVQQYEYSVNYGTTYKTLYALSENPELSGSNYFTFDKLRVAINRSVDNLDPELQQFALMNGFEAEQVFCRDAGTMIEALKNEEADVLLLPNIANTSSELKTVAQFSPIPFYFVATKGNTEVVNGVNSAIGQIREMYPDFEARLAEKYFNHESKEFVLSEEEKEFIRKSAPLNVLMTEGRAPIQYKFEAEIKGISKEVLDYIGEMTGLEFNYIMPDSYEEYAAVKDSPGTDIIAGDSKSSFAQKDENYMRTVDYATVPISIVSLDYQNLNHLEGKKLALPKGYAYGGEYEGSVVFYDSIYECLRAVVNGEADYCYANNYTVQYYLNHKEFSALKTIPQLDEWRQEYCFGVNKESDRMLVTILNKAINGISEVKWRETYLTVSSYSEEVSLANYLKHNQSQVAMIIGIFLLLLVITLLIFSRHHYLLENNRSKLENMRYEQINDLSNEFLFEYDAVKDKLKISGKSAEFLGCSSVVEGLSGRSGGDLIWKEKGYAPLFEYIASAKEGTKELRFKGVEDITKWYKVISKSTLTEKGELLFSIGKVVDVDEIKNKHDELLKTSQMDGLTGIYNAVSIKRRVEEILGRKEQSAAMAFIIMDIDRFKQVNDNFGHYMGDMVLKRLGELLLDIFSEDCINGRIGGDEFMVFAMNMKDRGEILLKCGQLRKAFGASFRQEKEIELSLSIGIAEALEEQSYEELYKKADQAMYIVKGRGRNGVEFLNNP